MWLAIGIAIPIGLVAGVLSALSEAGLLIDPMRSRAPTPVDQAKVLGLMTGPALPNGALALWSSEPIGLFAYFITCGAVFLLGTAVVIILWIRTSLRPTTRDLEEEGRYGS